MARETDIRLGRRLREARVSRGLSQSALAKRLGITFQQVQKYESGSNRVGGSRLWDLSCILDVPVGYFFEGLPDSQARAAVQGEDQEAPISKHSLLIAREIDSIRDQTLKMNILRLVKAITNTKSR